MRDFKLIRLVLIVLILSSMAKININFETKSVLENKVKIKVPKGFKELSIEEINLKYSGKKKPAVVFSDKTGAVTVTLEIIKDLANQDVIEKNTSNYNDLFVKIYKFGYEKENASGVIKASNSKVGFVRVLMSNKQMKKDYTLMCTFYCPDSEVEKWKVTAEKIMNSIKIK